MILYLLQFLLLAAPSPSTSYERGFSTSLPPVSSSEDIYSQLMKDYYEDEGISDIECNHTIIFAVKHDDDKLVALGKISLS